MGGWSSEGVGVPRIRNRRAIGEGTIECTVRPLSSVTCRDRRSLRVATIVMLIFMASGALRSGEAGGSVVPDHRVPTSGTEYVTNSQLATVSVVHGSTITGTITVGNGPVGI